MTVVPGQKRQCGKFLLEFATVVLGSTALMLGILDVYTLLQSRSALRAGVNEALRCLTTTSSTGGCRVPGKSQGSVTLPARYDVYASGYEIPFPSISGVGRWIEIPRIGFNVIRVPGDQVTVQFQQEMRRIGDITVRFPMVAVSEYLVETVPPTYLAGTSFSPDFRSLRNRNQRVTANVKYSTIVIPAASRTGPIIIGAQSEEDFDPQYRVGSSSFVVSALSAEGRAAIEDLSARGLMPRCFQPIADDPSQPGVSQGIVNGIDGASVNWSRAAEVEPCAASGVNVVRGAQVLVPVAFQVIGAAGVSVLGAEGKLSIEAEWKGLDGTLVTRRLGGRVFNAPILSHLSSARVVEIGKALGVSSPSGSLAFRGLPRSQISDPVFDEFQAEYTAHSAPLLVPDGTIVTLRFYLRKTAGSTSSAIAWRGDLIRVLYPEYTFVAQKLYSSSQDLPSKCVLSESQLIERGELHLSQAPITKCSLLVAEGPLVNQLSDEICHGIPQGMDALAEQDPTARISAIWDTAVRNPTSVTTLQKFRVSLESCSPKITAIECGATDTVTLYEGCHGEAIPPDALASCQNRIPADAVNIIVSYKKPAEGYAPQSIELDGCVDKTKIPACATMKINHQVSRIVAPSEEFSHCVATHFRTQPFGPLPLPVAATLEECMRNVSEHFGQVRSSVGIPREAAVALSCEAPIWKFTPTKPADDVTPYRITPPGELHQIAANTSKRYGEELCHQVSGSCELREKISSTIRLPLRPSLVDSSTDFARVTEVLYDTAKTVYPRLKPCTPTVSATGSTCRCEASDIDCLSVSVEHLPSSDTIQVSASAKIPLTMLSLLEGEGASVFYENRTVPEDRLR